jgi:hypothetical protein
MLIGCRFKGEGKSKQLMATRLNPTTIISTMSLLECANLTWPNIFSQETVKILVKNDLCKLFF